MSELYHLFIVHGFREAYYQLSAEGQNQFWSRIGEVGQAAGSKLLMNCYARWNNEACAGWGVEMVPDVQSLQQMARSHEKNQHYRYIEAETYIGTLMEGFQVREAAFPDPLYQLFLVKNQNNEAWTSLSEDTRQRLFSAVGESIDARGGVTLLGCDINWSNEEYAFFGVNAWPDIAAQQAHFQDLAKIGWHRYFYSRTILGTKYRGEVFGG